jgi:hypothetical protein
MYLSNISKLAVQSLIHFLRRMSGEAVRQPDAHLLQQSLTQTAKSQRCLSSFSLEQHAAGDLDALSVYPAVVIRKKSGDHGPNVIGQAGPSQRRHFGDALIHIGVVVTRLARFAAPRPPQ